MVKIPIRVLVVDDEKDFVEMLSLRLNESGQKVVQAFNGKECLDILEKDGIEALKEIKQRFPLVEVVMLTGHGTAETAVEGMKLGAYDYLLKPADFEELLGKLEAARNRKVAQEERIRRAEAKLLIRRSGGLS